MSGLRLATRRSPLALRQAELVRSRLAALDIESELVHVETSGDRLHDVPLASIGGQGVFVVEIQLAVVRGEADVAVHSAKDLPSEIVDGLDLVCAPERRDAADVLVGRSLAGLGPGATVATGSPRRRALLLERRPDLNIVELRGNMATRLDSAGRGGVDAVVAAAAALERLGVGDRAAERLDPQWFIPQVGQGTLALETRSHDSATKDVLARINDDEVLVALSCERAFLRELGAGCSIPAGAHAEVHNGMVELRGVMLALDGTRSVRSSLRGADPVGVGTQLARTLRDDLGGRSLMGWNG